MVTGMVAFKVYPIKEPASLSLWRLKGKKWLIVGNHDGSWMDKVDLNHYFVSVDNYLETTDGVHGMTICHYPLLAWKMPGERTWFMVIYSCGHKFRLLAVNSAPGTSAECRCGCE